jgi:hypothetical protein
MRRVASRGAFAIVCVALCRVLDALFGGASRGLPRSGGVGARLWCGVGGDCSSALAAASCRGVLGRLGGGCAKHTGECLSDVPASGVYLDGALRGNLVIILVLVRIVRIDHIRD